MNKLFLLIVIGLMTISLNGQSQVENMLRDAKTFNKAYLDKDFETFTLMTIPSIVELAGGLDVMVKVSKEQYKTMISGGMKFVSINPTKPSKIMLGGDDLHAILPQEVITKLEDDNYSRIAYFLASSSDEGKTWTFADLEPYDTESIKIFVPSFTGELEIPAVEYAEKIKD